MLGLGWTEMLVIGVVALIFIGPKDLPVVMGKVGQVIGQIQRMGREFQREINKTTGLDEVRNLRTSITAPLKKTADEIRRDFNAMGKDGQEKPTGVLKPTDPNSESVVEAIQQQAGMASAKKTNDELAADYGFKADKSTEKSPAVTGPASEPVKAVRASSRTATAKPVTGKAVTGKPRAAAKPKATAAKAPSAKTPVEAAPAMATTAAPAATASRAARKPAASRAAEPAADQAPKPAAKPRAPRKKPAGTAGKSE